MTLSESQVTLSGRYVEQCHVTLSESHVTLSESQVTLSESQVTLSGRYVARINMQICDVLFCVQMRGNHYFHPRFASKSNDFKYLVRSKSAL